MGVSESTWPRVCQRRCGWRWTCRGCSCDAAFLLVKRPPPPLQLRPRGAVIKRLVASMQPHLPAFSARDLAHTFWSLQRLRFLPDAGWMMEAQLALQV